MARLIVTSWRPEGAWMVVLLASAAVGAAATVPRAAGAGVLALASVCMLVVAVFANLEP